MRADHLSFFVTPDTLGPPHPSLSMNEKAVGQLLRVRDFAEACPIGCFCDPHSLGHPRLALDSGWAALVAWEWIPVSAKNTPLGRRGKTGFQSTNSADARMKRTVFLRRWHLRQSGATGCCPYEIAGEVALRASAPGLQSAQTKSSSTCPTRITRLSVFGARPLKV